jgi:SPP1 gp7 family putative phage head morphogenesis protein
MPILNATDPALVEFPWLADAVDYVTTMGIATPDSVRKMSDQMASRTFTVDGIDSIQVLADLKDALAEAVAKGQSTTEFRAAVADVATLKAGQAENILRTNLKAAYMDQWSKTQERPAVKKAFGYVKYVATQDGRTRPHHRALDGFVCSVDDPAYQTLWDTQHEHNCRCLLIALTEKQAERAGIKTKSDLPALAKG